MNKFEYPVVIHQLCEEDGGGFTAQAPDLAGCRGDGETHEAALSDLFAAMDEWCDEMRRLGRDIPTPYSLAERVARDDDSLRELVDAQASLIKLQEAALKEQNASLEELKEQVARLTAGVRQQSSDCTGPALRVGKLWGDGAAVNAVAKRMPIVKRPSHAH